jgi:hypothetical protein
MEFNDEQSANEAWAQESAKLEKTGNYNREVYEAYSRFFERQSAGKMNDTGNGSQVLTNLVTEAMQGQQPATPQDQPQQGGATLLQNSDVLPEVAAADAVLIERFQQKWGGEFEQNRQLIEQQALKEFKGDKDKLFDFIVKNNLDRDPDLAERYCNFLLLRAQGKI